ncbi:MAG: hypothetical protein GXX80_00245, partial [Thermotogaceae bacterium]|nr:hypothetical protein [Thermotogaceae bacterium]
MYNELIRKAEEKGFKVWRHTWGTQIFRGKEILPVSPVTEREVELVLKTLL